MAWKDSVPPLPPPHLAVTEVATNVFLLEWTPPAPAADGDTAIFYAVYRSVGTGASGSHMRSLATLTAGAVSYLDTIKVPEGLSYSYDVTAFDRGYNESTPSPTAHGIFRELLALRRMVSDVTSLSALVPSGSGTPTLAAYRVAKRAPVQLDLLRRRTDAGDTLVATITRETQDAGMYIVGLTSIPFVRGNYILRLRAAGTEIEQSVEVR
jgi:hypothetical protein